MVVGSFNVSGKTYPDMGHYPSNIPGVIGPSLGLAGCNGAILVSRQSLYLWLPLNSPGQGLILLAPAGHPNQLNVRLRDLCDNLVFPNRPDRRKNIFLPGRTGHQTSPSASSWLSDKDPLPLVRSSPGRRTRPSRNPAPHWAESPILDHRVASLGRREVLPEYVPTNIHQFCSVTALTLSMEKATRALFSEELELNRHHAYFSLRSIRTTRDPHECGRLHQHP